VQVLRGSSVCCSQSPTLNVMFLTADPTTDPFRNDLERETLRAELEDLVGKEHVPDLAAGDESTLDEHTARGG